MSKIDFRDYVGKAGNGISNAVRKYGSTSLYTAAYSTHRRNPSIDFTTAYDRYRNQITTNEYLGERIHSTAYADLAMIPIAGLQLLSFWRWMMGKQERLPAGLIGAGQVLQVMLNFYGFEGFYNRSEYRREGARDKKADAIAAIPRPLAAILGQLSLNLMAIDPKTGRPVYSKKSDKIKNFAGAALFTLTQIVQVIPWDLIAYGSHLSEMDYRMEKKEAEAPTGYTV
ncbi:hypothetical protein A3K63_00725 [Candidatus Micrarchaeota archaeon RBG_16_49_10]|nr:MAG: hypothetical protein A3K63_00725 [Candidatus Micrarchaeota archaeon RBG_16_49_10]